MSDLSLCATLLPTSPTLLFSLAVAFKKTILSTADMDMLQNAHAFQHYQQSMMVITYQIISYGKWMVITYQIISYGTWMENSNMQENSLFCL